MSIPLTPSQDGEPVRPLLSLTIPTYNRSVYLAELLECLVPQVGRGGTPDPRVELLISDNCSPDDTPALIARFQARGLSIRWLRNSENIGPDANFLQCLDLARGKYVWLMGDDDLLAPDTIPRLLTLLERSDFDLIYLSSAGFSGDTRPQPGPDLFGRFAEVVTSGDYFMGKVNAMITLISANIVNKDALLAEKAPPFTSLRDSNLIQLGWLLPLIHRRCRVLYVWERVLFHRTFNSGGWGICKVFGLNLSAIAGRYFAQEPSLARHLMNGVLSMWLPDHILQMRGGDLRTMEGEHFARTLEPVFRRNWRFWVFIWPAAELPLPLAAPIHRLNRTIMTVLRTLRTIVHHLTHRRNLIRP